MRLSPRNIRVLAGCFALVGAASPLGAQHAAQKTDTAIAARGTKLIVSGDTIRMISGTDVRTFVQRDSTFWQIAPGPAVPLDAARSQALRRYLALRLQRRLLNDTIR